MNSPRFNRGFSLIEMLITIGIAVVLASLILPVFQSAKKGAAAGACLANLRNIYQLSATWALDNNGYVPQSRWFVEDLPSPYTNLKTQGLQKKQTICPAAGVGSPSYGINTKLVTDSPQWGPADVYFWSHGKYKLSALSPKTIFFTETAKQSWSGSAGSYIAAPEYTGFPHSKKSNVLYADGHIEALDAAALKPSTVWTAGLPN